MLHRARALLMAAGFLGLGLALAPAVVAGDPCYHGYTIPPTTSEATSTVELDPCAFLPTSAQVAPGTTVSFVNRSTTSHLLMGANAAWGDRDTELPPGASVPVRFDEPGVYPYSCALHRGMTGAVIVSDVGAEVSVAATATGSPGGVSAQMIFVMVALAGLSVAGWSVALAQRRRPVGSAT